MSDTFGAEEYGVLYPTYMGGEPDRVLFYATNPSMNTLDNAETERQRWIDRGDKAFVVSRQWKVI